MVLCQMLVTNYTITSLCQVIMTLKVMNNCPCCSHPLLAHIRKNEVYWFCRTCWQEMPSLGRTHSNLYLEVARTKLPVELANM